MKFLMNWKKFSCFKLVWSKSSVVCFHLSPVSKCPSTCFMTCPTLRPAVSNAWPPGWILTILGSFWLVSLPPSITIPRTGLFFTISTRFTLLVLGVENIFERWTVLIVFWKTRKTFNLENCWKIPSSACWRRSKDFSATWLNCWLKTSSHQQNWVNTWGQWDVGFRYPEFLLLGTLCSWSLFLMGADGCWCCRITKMKCLDRQID